MKPALQEILPQSDAPEGLDPTKSVWVSASAGSGKTTLLVKRVLRLLLEREGAGRKDAPRILCLTYTRAAAAEMQNRIQSVLARWATASEDALRDDLAAQFHLKANKELLKHARRLFGQVLEVPERVRVATLHAFCQMVLNRFPIEAGVPPHFQLVEGDGLRRFQNGFLQGFLADLEGKPALQKSFTLLSARIGPDRLQKLFGQLGFNPEAWDRFFIAHPNISSYEEVLRTQLGLPEGLNEHGLLKSFFAGVDHAKLSNLVAALATSGKMDQDFSARLSAWMETKDGNGAGFDAYALAFLTKDGGIRKKIPAQAVVKKNPELGEIFLAEGGRAQNAAQQLFALRFFEAQTAWYQLFHALWLRMREEKIAQGVLGYDDLILRTRALLNNKKAREWVLYKLDGGIDHLLVDEAQDTSPAQWDILFALLEEFLSGKGAREDRSRSVFVVGDEKQSIYSFQGADRSRYLKAKDELFAKLKAAKRDPQLVELALSRRTPEAILSFVDAVFADETARTGVSLSIKHGSAREKAPSYVEFWPPVQEQEATLPTPWSAPLQAEESAPAPVQLAKNIAGKIKQWLDEAWLIHDSDLNAKRPVKPGDVLILLQRRSKLLLPLVRALKDAGVPVSGIDRMVLSQQPAVQDVLALCRFLLLPEDSLTLAEVLRGPFIRLSDDQLFALAHGRGETALWLRLQAKAEDDPAYQSAESYLKELLRITDFTPVFTLLNAVLFKPCPADAVSGQHALVTRLGPDAVDPLQELLSAALMHESDAPSLQLFVQAIITSEKESKRELSQAGQEVRILTVHSAKGLEAPIVIIPDLVRDPTKLGSQPSLFWSADGLPLTSGAGASQLLEDAKDNVEQAQEEENRRLFYVALTRAREVLILCGLAPSTSAPWHSFALQAMQHLKAEQLPDGIYRYGQKEAFAPPQKPEKAPANAALSLPAWVRAPMAEGGEAKRIINPSQVAAANEKMLAPSQREAAFRRGQLLHRLLQMLPYAKPEERAALAFDFLKHHQPDKSKEACQAEADEVMRVMNNPTFAPLFGEGSRAEVPVIGRVEGKRISGQIDRMAVTDKDVLIIDFKTNRPPPENVEDVSETYVAQMAAYRALLEKIYPNHKVRCALLWTHTLTLMELPEGFYTRGRAILGAA